MTIQVAINGHGRIGRNVLRAHYACKPTSVDQLDAVMKAASVGPLKGILAYNTTVELAGAA